MTLITPLVIPGFRLGLLDIRLEPIKVGNQYPLAIDMDQTLFIKTRYRARHHFADGTYARRQLLFRKMQFELRALCIMAPVHRRFIQNPKRQTLADSSEGERLHQRRTLAQSA